MSKFLDKVKSLFDPMADKRTTAPAKNIEDVYDDFIKNLMADLAQFRGKDDFKGITFWVKDNTFPVLNDEAFIERLKVAFDNDSFYSLSAGKIVFKHGVPDDGIVAAEFVKGRYWYSCEEKTVAVTARSARLVVVDGDGTINGRHDCRLNPEKKVLWHLGRGKTSRKDGLYRVNDIVIDGNDYVSSSHLDIVLQDGFFFVKAMPSGCRSVGGSPTKIIREGVPFEITDTYSLHPLHDGDMLDLGKSLLLEFKMD